MLSRIGYRHQLIHTSDPTSRESDSVIDTESEKAQGMKLVDFDLSGQHLLIGHDDIEHLPRHALEQQEAILFYMGDDDAW